MERRSANPNLASKNGGFDGKLELSSPDARKIWGPAEVYCKAFQLQWNFIKNYQIDSEFHGVYEMVGPTGVP